MNIAREILEKHLSKDLDIKSYLRTSPLTYQVVLDAIEEAINYTHCCKTLNLEVKPTFDEWLNTNFSKYDNEYYQDKNRNGIWKKHKLYKLYEETTKF